MSCHNSCTPCLPTNKVVGTPCAPKYFQCPVVCTPSVPDLETLSTSQQLAILLVQQIVLALENPSTYTCTDAAGQIVCIEQQTLPFTGQNVITIKIDLSSLGDGIAPFTLVIYEKCGTYWFKIPSLLLLDLGYASDYPGDIGSVSITKSSECPDKWNARILIDGFCFPINVEVVFRKELINECGCPPFIRHIADLIVESGFEKFVHSQSLQCLDSNTLTAIVLFDIIAQVQILYLEYVLSQQEFIKSKCCQSICAIGNQCGGNVCTSSD